MLHTNTLASKGPSGDPIATPSASADPGARFSEVPIVNGPVKLLLFAYKIEISIVLHLT